MDNTPILLAADGSELKKSGSGWVSGVAAVIALLALYGLGYATHYASKADKPVSPTATVSGVWATTSGTLTTVDISGVAPVRQTPELTWAARPRLGAPKDHPPSLIHVGPFIYSVNYTSGKALELRGAYAMTDTDSREIWLDPKRRADIRTDLTHELLHCARDLGTGGSRFIGTNDSEENAIEGISFGMVEILRDNPELREWLAAQPQG